MNGLQIKSNVCRAPCTSPEEAEVVSGFSRVYRNFNVAGLLSVKLRCRSILGLRVERPLAFANKAVDLSLG